MTGKCRTWWWSMMSWTLSSVSFELQDTSCGTEMNCETFMLTAAAPRSAIARTASRSVKMPTVVLPSVCTTSWTTTAPTLLARISLVAMPMVSFIRTVTTRGLFLLRISPTCIAASSRPCGEVFQMRYWYTLSQLSNLLYRRFFLKMAHILTNLAQFHDFPSKALAFHIPDGDYQTGLRSNATMQKEANEERADLRYVTR